MNHSVFYCFHIWSIQTKFILLINFTKLQKCLDFLKENISEKCIEILNAEFSKPHFWLYGDENFEQFRNIFCNKPTSNRADGTYVLFYYKYSCNFERVLFILRLKELIFYSSQLHTKSNIKSSD